MILKIKSSNQELALGKIHFLEEEQIEYKKSFQDIKKEKAILENAINKTNESIKLLIKKAKKEFTENEVDILTAHLEIANDITFKDEANKIIEFEKKTAYEAFKIVSDKYIEIFKSMDNEYMKQRSTDILDVASSVLSFIANPEKKVMGEELKESTIIVSKELTSSDILTLNRKYIKGFITTEGGPTSHCAIIAKSLQVPYVFGLSDFPKYFKEGQEVFIDGINETLNTEPNAKDRKVYEDYLDLVKKTSINPKTFTPINKSKDGKKVELAVNIDGVEEIERLKDFKEISTGLFRTEFLFMQMNDWPTEEEQFLVYKNIALNTSRQSEVVIRTLDIGGDKELKYFKQEKEMNPFLGNRSVRFSLNKPNTFITQIRAIYRASAFGNVAILLPFVSNVEELLSLRKIIDQVKKSMIQEKIEFDPEVKIGMMIEIPSSAVLADVFAQYVDFFSVGSNDLIQYTFAVDRVNSAVSNYFQPLNPAIYRLINMAIQGAHRNGKTISVCGEIASNKYALAILVAMGIDKLSMAPESLGMAKYHLNSLDLTRADELSKKVLEAKTQDEVIEIVKTYY
ncbi:phosphoenolpyruvate--protein phosphotransferase [[Mycoplasma] mobile]|uniref:Phosphoenolpyruvate-protein phosphotransferase n=1 Tax=Mycoplasma mobile (strain ATCC 43663 / 163K / NCTC 11711) TaxID=267748 RepID=Q6KIM9_MYCM1|nr:phosphoenolpyruvate--protein phosphotransferase [[Mycoplasma] mobile]AAT27547.1 phosphoenolpyruvate-protein phosphotransferase enzyme I [Mycoplasma mobile 163K]